MTSLTALLEQPLARALAWALLHFLWQGAAIGLCVWAAGRFLSLSAATRYALGVGALVMMVLAPVATTVVLSRDASDSLLAVGVVRADSSAEAASLVVSTVNGPLASVAADSTSGLSRLAPAAILTLWLAGVLLLALRFAGGWAVALQLPRRATRPVAPEIDALARQVASRLALARIVRCLESAAVAVPVTVGWITPVVLFPASALSGLSLAQIEALLAHELAHVRRHDYLINLLQSAVETLLFYHPAVWWVSHRVRADRELCCDDIAVGVCDRLVYATALSDLAAMTIAPRMAMAATDGPLLSRVRRVLGKSDGAVTSRAGWAPAFLVLLVAGALVPAAGASARAVTLAPLPEAVREVPREVEVPRTPEGPELAHRRAIEVRAQLMPALERHLVLDSQTPAQTMGADRQREQLRAEAVKESIADQIKVLLAQLKELDRERFQVQLERMLRDMQARQAELISQVELQRDQRTALEQQLAAGLIARDAVQAAAAAEAKLKREVIAAKADQEIVQHEFLVKLKSHLQDQELALRSVVEARREQERKIVELKQAEPVQAEARAKDLAAMVQTRKAQLMSSELAQRERRLRDSEPVTDAAAKIAANDVLVIVVHNEPDLPTSYAVQADGTIRFPLIGAIRVSGLTVAEARTAIVRQFSERKFANAVDVSLRRPRVHEIKRQQ